MVLASRLCLLVGPIWVHLLALELHHRLYTGLHISVGSRSISFVFICCYTTPCCIYSSCTWLFVQIELLPPDYSKHQWFAVSSRACYLSKVFAHHDSPSSQWYRATIVSLPIYLLVVLGFVGICDPYSTSGENYNLSYELSCPLVNLILQQCDSLPHDVIDSQCFILILKQLSQAKHQSQVDTAESVLAHSPVSLCQALECCKEKGASSWLSAIPIYRTACMGLHFIRLTLLMPYVYIMAGLHHAYHLTVFTAKPFQFLMILAVRTVPFPSSAITMYEIWPQN